MKYRITHKSIYDYENPVLHGRHVVRKRPRNLPYQSVQQSSLHVVPSPVWAKQELDYYENSVDVVEVIEPHDRLEVTAKSEVEVGPRPIDTGLPLFLQSWEALRDRVAEDRSQPQVAEMLLDSPLVRRHESLRNFALETFQSGRPLFSAIVEFNHRIFSEFTYDPTFSDVATPLARVLRERRGVCQDFAHVAVGALRSIGLPARYVSGYLETKAPEGRPRLIGADASHAWASVHVPEFGWIAFDPTNDLLPGERHIVVAWGRDFSDVSPLRGVVHGGGRHAVSVSVDVAPLTSTFPGSVVSGGIVAATREENPAQKI